MMMNADMAELIAAARDYAEYHSDYEDADLRDIATGTLTDDIHTDKTARLILAARLLGRDATVRQA